VQDRVFGVFDLVQGTNYSLNYLMRSDRMALTRTAGRTLAQLHQSLENCVPDGQHHMGFASLTGTRHRDVAWHTVKIEELQGRSAALDEPEAASRAGSLVARAERLLEEITTLEHRLSQAEFPRLVIHGDYGLHNLLFDGRDMAVVVDFELARLDWRLNDLISVLGKHRYRGGHYDLDSMETFVRAYTSVFPLTADERDLLVDAWRLYKLQAAVQYWNSYFETSGPVRKLESAIDSLGQADLVATRPDLIDRLKCATSSAASPRGVGTNAGSSKPPRQPGAVDGGDS
jgi:Ser/Thr protein kinase RdoA (MazF antagonist)